MVIALRIVDIALLLSATMLFVLGVFTRDTFLVAIATFCLVSAKVSFCVSCEKP